MMCEKCWGDAYLRYRMRGGFQADHYRDILKERDEAGEVCTPREQAGQFWDEEKQCDSRC